MTPLGAGLKAALDADAAVGALAGDRTYPVFVPAEEPKVLPLNLFSVTYSTDVDLDSAPFVEARVQVHAWSLDYDEAHALADANEEALHGTSGAFGGATVRHFIRASRQEGVGELAPDSHAFVMTSTFDVLMEE